MSQVQHEAGQILHLKRLLVTLKQHYEKILQDTNTQLQDEKDQKILLAKELERLQQQVETLQKEHEEELQALRDQQSLLKERLRKAEEQAHLSLQTMQKCQDEQFETVVSSTSSLYLRQELEGIKKNLAQGSLETKALEARYVEILNEKIQLDNQQSKLQSQLENQSYQIASFLTELQQREEQKQQLHLVLREKEKELEEKTQECQAFQQHLRGLSDWQKEKEYLQDKYEQLKEEWIELSDSLEEAIDARSLAEEQVRQLEKLSHEQAKQLEEHFQRLQLVDHEKQNLEGESSHLQVLIEESEMRLKVAQQHLAKKVKETALLTEKVGELQISLKDHEQALELQKTLATQLQASVDLYQRQEKKWQDQLHDALKGTETQVAKWEEKYFRMYDKLQESEARVRKLEELEKKHQQMQHLLKNLGSFMGSSLGPPAAGFLQAAESISKGESQDEKYDLFGMKPAADKYKPNLFS